MKTKLGNWGRTLLIGLAGTALVATTLATSDVRACMRNQQTSSDDACSVADGGLTVSIGPLRVVFAR